MTLEAPAPVIDWTLGQDNIFTKAFWQVRQATARYVVVYGSSGSSKSYSVHQSELINIMSEGEGDILFFRKHATDHQESCYKLLNQLIEKYELQPWFKSVYSNDKRRITYIPTGRSISFKGLDDTEKIKSITGFKRVVIEEANQLTFDDFKEVIRRLRGYEGIQFILILNPISENHWIKTQLCDEKGPYHPKTEVLRFNYQDNCNALGESFVTQEDIEALEILKLVDENQYRIYALGEWGVEDKNKKFVWAFERDKHIVPTTYEPERILWASFDFNVNPLTCTLFQVFAETHTLRAIECVKLENSDIWKMCDRIIAGYPEASWMVTGDATGASRQAISMDNLNYYQVIQSKLGIATQQIMVPTKNPPIEENQLIVNSAFKLWNIEIDGDRCQPLIYDVTYVELNEEKKIIKDRSSDKKNADFLDTLRYLINVAIKPYLNIRTH